MMLVNEPFTHTHTVDLLIIILLLLVHLKIIYNDFWNSPHSDSITHLFSRYSESNELNI